MTASRTMRALCAMLACARRARAVQREGGDTAAAARELSAALDRMYAAAEQEVAEHEAGAA